MLETKHQPQLRDSKANSTLALIRNSSFNRAHNQWGISSEIKPDYDSSQYEFTEHLTDKIISEENKRKSDKSLKRTFLKKNESSYNSQTNTSNRKGKERNINSKVKRINTSVSKSNTRLSEKESILSLLLTTMLQTKHQPQLRDSKANSTLALIRNSSFNRAHNQRGISSEIKPDKHPDYDASQYEFTEHVTDKIISEENKRKSNKKLKRTFLKKNESSYNSQTNTSNRKGKERKIHSKVKRINTSVSKSNTRPSEKESGPVRYKTKSSLCTALMQGKDKTAIVDAERYMRTHKHEAITRQDYIRLSRNCTSFKNTRGYQSKPMSKEEAGFPLAFSIVAYKDVEQIERLLRSIYMPQNFYCMHIDAKADKSVYSTIKSITRCFPNVFIAEHRANIYWGEIGVLMAEIHCMRELVKHYRGKWKYFMNLTGQEFPLKTNYELVRILKAFKGTNHIAGTSNL